MITRNKGIKKEIWFSICSKHRIHDDTCPLCNKGHWQNAIKYKIGSFVHDLTPSLWRWFVNR